MQHPDDSTTEARAAVLAAPAGADNGAASTVRLPSGPIGRLLASVGNLSHLLGSIHSDYAHAHGLGTRGIWTLSAISEGHTTPGDIARLMKIPASVVSGDLAQLLAAGLIQRIRDPKDGRRLIHSLTVPGQAMLAGAHQVYVELLGEKMASYPTGQVDAALRLLYEISEHVRRQVGSPDKRRRSKVDETATTEPDDGEMQCN